VAVGLLECEKVAELRSKISTQSRYPFHERTYLTAQSARLGTSSIGGSVRQEERARGLVRVDERVQNVGEFLGRDRARLEVERRIGSP